MRFMKRILAISLLTCALISACGTTNDRARHGRTREHRFGGGTAVESDTYYTETPPSQESAPAPEENKPAPAPAPTQATAPTPTPAPVVKHEAARTGIPVQGKPGFVRSPYAPESGLIDVRGYPTGTEVKDPYAPGKILLVP
jgi:hypothetical protein